MDKEQIHSCIDRRITGIRDVMRDKDIDILILTSPEHIYHVSDFNPVLFSHPMFFILPVEGEPTLLVHSLRGRHASLEAATKNILCHGKWGNEEYVDLDPYKALGKVVGTAANKRVACDLGELDVVSYGKICGCVGAEEMVNFSDEMFAQTTIKDAYAIEMLRGAAEIADRGMEVLVKCISEKTMESEAVTRAQYAMRKLWQEKYQEYEICGFGTHGTGIIDSLNCWVLTDYRISFGCDCSRDTVPSEGELVLPMVWGKLSGYHAENERSLIVGEGSEYKMRAFEAMTIAHKNVLDMVSPGCPIKDLYNEAIRIFTDFGFGDVTPGRIGHGMGLSPHEEPSISGTNELLLQPGMVFTVEPGLTNIEWGGVRHSDTVLVTYSGCEILTHGDTGIIRV